MDANQKNIDQLKAHMETLMGDVNGIVNLTESFTKQAFENISPEEAKKLAKAMEKANVSKEIEQLKKNIESLGTMFNTK